MITKDEWLSFFAKERTKIKNMKLENTDTVSAMALKGQALLMYDMLIRAFSKEPSSSFESVNQTDLNNLITVLDKLLNGKTFTKEEITKYTNSNAKPENIELFLRYQKQASTTLKKNPFLHEIVSDLVEFVRQHENNS